jgi:hypothetical protein
MPARGSPEPLQTVRPGPDQVDKATEALEAATRRAAGPHGDAKRSHGQYRTAEPAFRIGILGPLEVSAGGERIVPAAPKQRAMLAMLALYPNAQVHRETLIDAVWGQDPPITAVNLVQSYVSRLRRVLEADPDRGCPGGRISSAGAGYCLHLKSDELDLLAFGQLIAVARDRRASDDSEGCCSAYEQALDLWRGEPLDDIEALRAHPAVTGLRNR